MSLSDIINKIKEAFEDLRDTIIGNNRSDDVEEDVSIISEYNDIINRSIVNTMNSDTIKTTIRSLINNKHRFALVSDIYVYLDGFCYDASDDDVVRFIAKFNTSAMTDVEPTFGTIQHSTGLQEVIIPYSMIWAVEVLDANENLLELFRTKYPKQYENWSKANHVEGCLVLPELPGINSQLNNNN